MKQSVNEYDEALDALTSGMLDTSDIEDGNCWRTPIGIYIATDDTDRWAYIELPED